MKLSIFFLSFLIVNILQEENYFNILKNKFLELENSFDLAKNDIKTENYYNFFKELNKTELLSYENEILSNTTQNITIHYKYRLELDESISNISEILNKENLTMSDLLKTNNIANLNQNEINKLFYKKLDYIKKIPFDKNNLNEEKYYTTIKYLYKKYYNKNLKYNLKDNSIPDVCNGRIDLLWTYVNSSDPIWKDEFIKYKTDNLINRFRDYNSIKYSMRSAYKNLKFVKHWWMVLYGPSQIPKFLNLKKLDENEYVLLNEKNRTYTDIFIHFVFHKDIFPDKNFLPIFSSEGIEAAFGFIKGISECIVYIIII